jgi:hypothetical protein
MRVRLVLLMWRRARSRIRERWRTSRFSEYGDSMVGALLVGVLIGRLLGGFSVRHTLLARLVRVALVE